MTGEATRPGRGEALASHRVAEVLVTRSPGSQDRGSGYRVREDLVLTAAHVVADVDDVTLRFAAEQPGEWSTPGTVAWLDRAADVALVRLERVDGAAVAPTRFGRLPATAGRAQAEVVGFPRWKLRTVPGVGLVREAHHVVGSIAGLSNPKSRTLEIKVDMPGADPDPAVSPWEAMSGAAVWVGSSVVGVVSAHHRPEGLGFLTAVRIEQCLSGNGELRGLLGLTDEPLMNALATDEIPGGVGAEPADDDVVDALTSTMSRQWAAELRRRGLSPPAAAMTTWWLVPAAPAPLPITVTDYQRRQERLAGELDDILARFRSLPSRQLVILGAEGTGKTALALLLAFHYLRTRTAREPVPVLFSLSSWESAGEDIENWLVRQLCDEWPDICTPEVARDLVLSARILPILDGVDEVAPAARPALIDAIDEAAARGADLVLAVRSHPDDEPSAVGRACSDS